jgi:hypothetical protein
LCEQPIADTAIADIDPAKIDAAVKNERDCVVVSPPGWRIASSPPPSSRHY